MKVKLIDEFLNKVDRPWGMSKNELEQFQREVKQLKSEQNKVAVEKLEELHNRIYKNKCIEMDLTIYVKYDDFTATLDQIIEELKGEK